MSNIFICYSRISQDKVDVLAQDLEQLGHTVWFDKELTGGQVWWDQILQKIRECDVLVFTLAPDSLESHACKLEYTYASDLGKIILPVLVADGVSPTLLPAVLSKIQYIDYRNHDKDTAFSLVKAMNNLPASRKLPDPLPKTPEVPLSYLGNIRDQIDTTSTLSFEEQTALVIRLKERIKESDLTKDVTYLLRLLRKRDDLFAKVATEIDTILDKPKEDSSIIGAKDKTEGKVQTVEEKVIYADEVEKPKKIRNAIISLFILGIHIGLSILMAALIYEIRNYSSAIRGYRTDDTMALIVFLVSIFLLIVLGWILLRIRGAMKEKPRSLKFYNRFFPRGYAPRTAFRSFLIGFLWLIGFSIFSLLVEFRII